MDEALAKRRYAIADARAQHELTAEAWEARQEAWEAMRPFWEARWGVVGELAERKAIVAWHRERGAERKAALARRDYEPMRLPVGFEGWQAEIIAFPGSNHDGRDR